MPQFAPDNHWLLASGLRSGAPVDALGRPYSLPRFAIHGDSDRDTASYPTCRYPVYLLRIRFLTQVVEAPSMRNASVQDRALHTRNGHWHRRMGCRWGHRHSKGKGRDTQVVAFPFAGVRIVRRLISRLAQGRGSGGGSRLSSCRGGGGRPSLFITTGPPLSKAMQQPARTAHRGHQPARRPSAPATVGSAPAGRGGAVPAAG